MARKGGASDRSSPPPQKPLMSRANRGDVCGGPRGRGGGVGLAPAGAAGPGPGHGGLARGTHAPAPGPSARAALAARAARPRRLGFRHAGGGFAGLPPGPVMTIAGCLAATRRGAGRA